MLGKISLQYESSYKNISTAKFYFKWLSLLYPRLLHFYFLRHTHWKNGKNCHLSSFYLFLKKKRAQFLGRQQFFFSTTINKNSEVSFVPASLGRWWTPGSSVDLGDAMTGKGGLGRRANPPPKKAHFSNKWRLILPIFHPIEVPQCSQ